ncbi:hypothetical protein COCNU_scaffold013865G000020 [Cocos nucifera]|nr:hypothetical protein [Cocos nucifera]
MLAWLTCLDGQEGLKKLMRTTNSTPAVAPQNPTPLTTTNKKNNNNINAKLDQLAALLTSLPCSSPFQLNQIHAHLLRSPLRPSSLLSAFDRAVRAVSKTKPLLALRLYLLMTRANLRPSSFTLPFLLNSVAAILLPSVGAELHSRALRSGLLSFLPVANALVDMYSKCRALHLARQAFNEMPLRDVVSHNALLGGYARLGVDMAAARKLFDEMPERNVISWNAMVVGYANVGDLAAARDVFDKMPEVVSENCTDNVEGEEEEEEAESEQMFGILDLGVLIHGPVIKSGLRVDRFVEIGLVDMFAKCGVLCEAVELCQEMCRIAAKLGEADHMGKLFSAVKKPHAKEVVSENCTDNVEGEEEEEEAESEQTSDRLDSKGREYVIAIASDQDGVKIRLATKEIKSLAFSLAACYQKLGEYRKLRHTIRYSAVFIRSGRQNPSTNIFNCCCVCYSDATVDVLSFVE